MSVTTDTKNSLPFHTWAAERRGRNDPNDWENPPHRASIRFSAGRRAIDSHCGCVIAHFRLRQASSKEGQQLEVDALCERNALIMFDCGNDTLQ